MFGRRQRREERLYWQGFRDALVPYVRGFEDGKQAAKRIHRDALVSEVSSLSLKPGDKLVVRCKDDLSPEAVERISETLKPRFPDNEILIFPPNLEPSVIRPDGKVVAQATAEIGNDQAARS